MDERERPRLEGAGQSGANGAAAVHPSRPSPRPARAPRLAALSDPPRVLWAEIGLVLAVLAELAIVIVQGGAIPRSLLREDASTLLVRLIEDAGPFALIAGGALLLLRHGRWRWALPLVLVVNLAAQSIVLFGAAVYAFADRERSRWKVVAFTLVAAAGMTLPWLAILGEGYLVSFGMTLVFGIAAMTMGLYAQARRALLEQLRSRADDLERERTSAQEEARRAERTRIAREMHDIVAHKISLVALQAGALEVNQNLPREEVVRSAGLIRSTAAAALSELREVLGVLRSEDDQAPLAPQPTWDDVRSLVDASRSAGIEVDLFDFIDDPVPDALARTAYRVVQEGLTNIHKHARHTRARIALIGEPEQDLLIEISNVLPHGWSSDLPGARMGLSGIETRVAHAGGTISSGPTDDGRFTVKAVIPWPRTSARSA